MEVTERFQGEKEHGLSACNERDVGPSRKVDWGFRIQVRHVVSQTKKMSTEMRDSILKRLRTTRPEK